MKLLILLLLVAVRACLASEEYVVISSALSTVSVEEWAAKTYGSTRRSRPRPRATRKVHHRSSTYTLVTDMDAEDRAIMLKEMPGVFQIIPNAVIETAESTTQWNLDRIDQSFGMDGQYTVGPETGSNVDMYVMDTGVRGDHVAFGGRVLTGVNVINPEGGAGNEDCHGHGTHVASTAAGDVYGVARGSAIIPVAILDCNGRGTIISLVAGVSWITQSLASRGSSRRAVVNLSIQAQADDVIDSLIRDLYSLGCVVVVAAANANSDACNFSPARERVAITVGGTSEDDSKLDLSNWGSCVDIYAPGDMIAGADFRTTTGAVLKRGTSMASPLVAGIACLILQRFPAYTNAQVTQAILRIATILADPVSDEDCAGGLKGKRFLQTMSASIRPSSLNQVSQLARGGVLRGEFRNWSPELSLEPSKTGEICIAFSARIVAARAAISQASVRVAVSTSILQTGVDNFNTVPMGCKNYQTKWYILDSFAEDRQSSRVYDFHDNIIGALSRPPSAQLSDRTDKNFYVYLRKMDDDSVYVELGSDGLSKRVPIVSGVDVFGNLFAFRDLTRISFSSTDNYDIAYTKIQACPVIEGETRAPVSTQAPAEETLTPTPGKATPAPSAPMTLKVTRAQRNRFSSWIWPKSPARSTSCFQFAYKVSRLQRVFVAFATQALGDVHVLSPPSAGDHSYVIVLSATRVVLMRDGVAIHTQAYYSKIQLSARVSIQILNEGGEIVVRRETKPGSWVLLYAYTDVTAPKIDDKQFSVVSSRIGTFSGVKSC